MNHDLHVGNGIIVHKKWVFDENVSKKFDVHIKKSIPLYEIGHDIILDCLEIFLANINKNKKIIISDLGCSTGLLIYKISKKFSDQLLEFNGIDKEESMLGIAKKRKYSVNHKIFWQCTSVEVIKNFKSDIIIAHYVLQFTKKSQRKIIIKNIYKNLRRNGIFIFFEKIKHNNKKIEYLNRQLITRFKLKQGFNLEEIDNKDKSLKGILIPNTLEDNFKLLEEAGFKKYTVILQYASFTGIIAIK